jgi:mannose-6-phosphate isomerase-like protein (cupin superfamily)
MKSVVVNLAEKLSRFDELWSPKIIAQMNDYQLKLVKVKGEFVWHTHAETDEVFLVLKGRLRIELKEGVVTLGEGELYVAPKGILHRPVAEEECHLLLVEPAGTINTGDTRGGMTAEHSQWI